jgi:signal peptidase I
MASHPIKVVLCVLSIPLLALAWIFFAPTQIGGSTTFSETDGISMQPMLVQGDFAVVRAQSTYKVGEVVLYQNQVINRDVLHRIILIQNDRYYFKGDNNDFVDPGYATKSELIGQLWFHLPKVGEVLGWLGKPLHAALLAGVGAFAFAMSELAPKGSKRKRHRRSLSRRKAHLPAFASSRAPPRWLDSGSNILPPPPLTTVPSADSRESLMKSSIAQESDIVLPFESGAVASSVIAVLLLLCAIFLLTGLSRPTKVLTPFPGAYTQSGKFAYSGAAPNAPTVYPRGMATTGEPLYPSLVKTVEFSFHYHFDSAYIHEMKGTIQLKAKLYSQIDTWKREFLISGPAHFVGNSASVKSDFPLSSLLSLIGTVTSSSGIAQDSFIADVVPIVHISGTVDGHEIHQQFSPALPFLVTKNSITLDPSVAPILPGASYVAPTQAATNAAALHPVVLGSLPRLATNNVTFAKYLIPVAILRLLGYLFALAALFALGFHIYVRRQHAHVSDEVLIASQFQSFLVPVESLGVLNGQSLITLDNFTDLAKLAQFLQRPILVEHHDLHREYAVDDDLHRYSFRAMPHTPLPKKLIESTTKRKGRKHQDDQ